MIQYDILYICTRFASSASAWPQVQGPEDLASAQVTPRYRFRLPVPVFSQETSGIPTTFPQLADLISDRVRNPDRATTYSHRKRKSFFTSAYKPDVMDQCNRRSVWYKMCMRACTDVCTYVCMHVCVCIYKGIHTDRHLYIYMYYTHIHI